MEEIKIEVYDEIPSGRKIYFAILAYFLIFAGGVVIYHLGLFQASIMHAIGTLYIQCIMYISFVLWYWGGFQKKTFFFHIVFWAVVFSVTFLIREKYISKYFSFLYLMVYLVIFYTIRENQNLGDEILLSPKKFKTHTLWGVVAGIIFSGHLFLSVKMSGGFFYFEKPQIDNFVYWLLYGISLNSLGEEMFFRGLLFKEFTRYRMGFWMSAISSSLFFTSRYIASPDALVSPAVTLGLFFYLTTGGIISCFLVHRTKSLIPSIIFNICFNTVANLIEIKV